MSRRSLQVCSLAVTVFSMFAPATCAQAPRPLASLGVPTVGTVEIIVDELPREAAVPPSIPSARTRRCCLSSLRGNNIGGSSRDRKQRAHGFAPPRNSLHPNDMRLWESLCTGGRETGRRISII